MPAIYPPLAQGAFALAAIAHPGPFALKVLFSLFDIGTALVLLRLLRRRGLPAATVLLFAWNPLALQGAVMTMICHGLSTGGLFIIVGGLQQRIHTRDIGRMGGLWAVAPRLSAVALFFSLASLGLPGLGDFVGEFLVLLGTYQVSISITAIASLGVLASTFYALRMVQRAFQGPNTGGWQPSDLTAREGIVMAVMIAGLLWLGFYPQPVLDTFTPAMSTLQQHVQAPTAALGGAR